MKEYKKIELKLNKEKQTKVKEYLDYVNKFYYLFLKDFKNKQYKSKKENIKEYHEIKKEKDKVKDHLVHIVLKYLDYEVKRFFASHYEYTPSQNKKDNEYCSKVISIDKEKIELACLGEVKFQEEQNDLPEQIKYPLILSENDKFFVKLIN